MTIKGIFKKSIFRSDSGYVIGLFKVKEAEEDIPSTITFTGYFHELTIDDSYTFNGEFIDHPKYGIQFQVESYEKLLPEEKDGIIEFLSGGLFKGIGEKTAKKIVDKLGDDTLNIILNDPSNLLLIGIKQKQIDTLYNTLIKYQESFETIVYLSELGFSTKDSLIIYNKYKEHTKSILEENIYMIYYDILNMPFKRLDSIFLKHNSKDDIRRIEAVIIYTLTEVCFTIGHTYLSINEIYTYLSRYIGFNVDKELFLSAINNLILDLKLVSSDDKYYLKDMYDAEENIAKRLGYLMRKSDNYSKKLDNLITSIENNNEYFYNDKQKEALRNSFIKDFLIITGGPGTGKTTTIKGIVELYKEINKLSYDALCKDVVLLAPTGRASKRISEFTMLGASTIHRFLKWNKEKNTFGINEYNKSDVKMVIIDEFSMVDTLLFNSLLKGLKYDTKIIIVGDYNQLPSVSSGQLLKDMIESNCLNVTMLTDLYRQEENSGIITLAHDINNNSLDLDNLYNSKSIEFYEETSVMNKIIEIAKKNKNLDKFQILAPMYKTLNGIDSINRILQDIYNPKTKNKKEIVINNVLYREDDKVIQLSNMPDENVFNGDIGYICEIENSDSKSVSIKFDSNIVKYTPSNFNKFSLAYCISIHKSQGSEFDNVLIPVLKEYNKMLYKKLIYTAVTRAKKKLYLIGDINALKYSISNDRDENRKTSLKEMLINNICV